MNTTKAPDFCVTRMSIAGAPTIEFQVRGATMTADLAGAVLTASAYNADRANLRILAADGALLADLMVRKMPTLLTITESVANIGAALLWSHWHYEQARARDEAVAQSLSGSGQVGEPQ